MVFPRLFTCPTLSTKSETNNYKTIKETEAVDWKVKEYPSLVPQQNFCPQLKLSESFPLFLTWQIKKSSLQENIAR
ncbi:Protein of unknown function [Gryllus bimaculatus]|nr:Protein of unknown function [Gryllus bimaculatus]